MLFERAFHHEDAAQIAFQSVSRNELGIRFQDLGVGVRPEARPEIRADPESRLGPRNGFGVSRHALVGQVETDRFIRHGMAFDASCVKVVSNVLQPVLDIPNRLAESQPSIVGRRRRSRFDRRKRRPLTSNRFGMLLELSFLFGCIRTVILKEGQAGENPTGFDVSSARTRTRVGPSAPRNRPNSRTTLSRAIGSTAASDSLVCGSEFGSAGSCFVSSLPNTQIAQSYSLRARHEHLKSQLTRSEAVVPGHDFAVIRQRHRQRGDDWLTACRARDEESWCGHDRRQLKSALPVRGVRL